MDILDLRHFGAHDLRPLLEREADLWSRTMDWDYRASAEMILRYVEAKILPGYAAVDSGRIAGYSFFVYEGSKGIIGDLFVDPESKSAEGRRGWKMRNGNPRPEDRLLTHVIETLQQSPGIHRIEAQLLVHDTGVVAAPFQQEGFRRFPRVFMSMPLTRVLPPPTHPPDLEFRPWREDDFQAAAALITAAYRGHIDADINDQYRSVAGSLRFLNNIIRFPGCGAFDPSASFVAVQKLTHMVVGLLLCSRIREDVGHVTQVCTLPEQQGRGIGRLLIDACARQLQHRKFSALSLTVTQANTNAICLYEKLGFHSVRTFDAFVWEG